MLFAIFQILDRTVSVTIHPSKQGAGDKTPHGTSNDGRTVAMSKCFDMHDKGDALRDFNQFGTAQSKEVCCD